MAADLPVRFFPCIFYPGYLSNIAAHCLYRCIHFVAALPRILDRMMYDITSRRYFKYTKHLSGIPLCRRRLRSRQGCSTSIGIESAARSIIVSAEWCLSFRFRERVYFGISLIPTSHETYYCNRQKKLFYS